jgi:hypothetical protein
MNDDDDGAGSGNEWTIPPCYSKRRFISFKDHNYGRFYNIILFLMPELQ